MSPVSATWRNTVTQNSGTPVDDASVLPGDVVNSVDLSFSYKKNMLIFKNI
jgi:hypothetical protein